MTISSQVRACLEAGDVNGIWDLWSRAMPHLPQPHTFAEAETSMHYARTAAQSVRFWKRAYSHAWLTERGIPSGMPDHLRPRAERLYPRIVDAVGIAVKPLSQSRSGLAEALGAAMRGAVMECYADSKTEPDFVRARMREASTKVLKGD